MVRTLDQEFSHRSLTIESKTWHRHWVWMDTNRCNSCFVNQFWAHEQIEKEGYCSELVFVSQTKWPAWKINSNIEKWKKNIPIVGLRCAEHGVANLSKTTKFTLDIEFIIVIVWNFIFEKRPSNASQHLSAEHNTFEFQAQKWLQNWQSER